MSSIHIARSPNASSRRSAARAALVEPRARRLTRRALGAVAATALTGVALYTALAAPGAGAPEPVQQRARLGAVAARESEGSPPVPAAPAPVRAQLLAELRRRLASALSTSVAAGEGRGAERASPGPAAMDLAALESPAAAGAGGELDAVSRARQRAHEELQLLNVQQPQVFLQAMFAEHDQSYAAGRVREATQRFIQRRTELLRWMLTAQLEASSDYEGAEVLSELEALAADFRTSVEEFQEDFPGVLRLPEVLSQTALPLPRFMQLRLAAAARGAAEEAPALQGSTPP